ncbi:MAG: chromate transporter [Clostridia bacterium]|nr:chromate transporter [Clostridia bacterium]
MEKTDKKEYFKRLWQLFVTFFKIGAFTFGGGYAMIPLIQREVSEKRKWITDEEILEVVAIAESTPGPIAVNSATFVGYKVCGFWGSFMCTLGVVLPSFLIILAISGILELVKDFKAVKYAFMGIRAGVLALIIKALIKMYKACPKGLVSYIIMGLSFVFAAVVKIDVIIVVIACAIIGLVTSVITDRRAKK